MIVDIYPISVRQITMRVLNYPQPGILQVNISVSLTLIRPGLSNNNGYKKYTRVFEDRAAERDFMLQDVDVSDSVPVRCAKQIMARNQCELCITETHSHNFTLYYIAHTTGL